ncbi:MAG: ribulose-phosphate 3-epimerase [Bdellovibrio sp.]|nr:MAG: ribulose-phosphate 3-epimerase [Bdellovibrio sp.]
MEVLERPPPPPPEANSFLIAPSILSADFANLQRELEAVAAAGADWIHVDVMDGHFVPNLTVGAPVVAALRKVTKLPLDVHLMIDKPERYMEDFLKAGSDIVTFHVEASLDPRSLLEKIRGRGKKSGISLRPATPVEVLLPLLPFADLVLVMTVEPGFGGQSFMNDQAAKIQRLRQEIGWRKLATLIEVDGGINAATKASCKDADVLVAGNFIFQHAQGYGPAIKELRGKTLPYG